MMWRYQKSMTVVCVMVFIIIVSVIFFEELIFKGYEDKNNPKEKLIIERNDTVNTSFSKLQTIPNVKVSKLGRYITLFEFKPIDSDFEKCIIISGTYSGGITCKYKDK